MEPPFETVRTGCCIAGGGPAGMMLGYLLARAGVDVTVLEKHGDFLRDFRGDTIHPSTLELMGELGLLEEFLKLPHQEARQLRGYMGSSEFVLADFSHLKVRCPFIALMPQWDFLNFLASQARHYPSFHLHMNARVTELVYDGGAVTGLRAATPEGTIEVRADLVVGADGRHSAVRDLAGLEVLDTGAPIDVLWMRIPRAPSDPDTPMGRFERGRMFVMIYRGDYWQCAYVIPKGDFDAVRAQGLETFRTNILAAAPFLAERVEAITGWDDVKLLTVSINHLRRWHRPGLVCIGDAAHAMSPVGGVGINLAVQDAVAAARILSAPLREHRLTENDLRAVQRRREFPARMTQRLQVVVQRRIFGHILDAAQEPGEFTPPLLLRLLARSSLPRRVMAYLVGVGFRPEHVE